MLASSGGAGHAAHQLAQEGSRDGFGIGWLDVPAEQADDPRSNRYLTDHVSPGSGFSRRIRLVNHGQEAIEVSLYVVPAEVEDGSLTVRDGVRTQLVDWIRLDPDRVRIPPRADVSVTARFDVDAAATEGEHLGVIFAEAVTSEGRLEVRSRVGLRVYLSVGEGGAPAPNFSILEMVGLRGPDGSPSVEVLVENTGGRVLDVAGTIELSDGPGGLRAGPFDVTEPVTLDVGDRGIAGFVFPSELPDGPWLARADLRSGLIERSAEATIEFPATAGASSDPVEAEEVPLHRDRGVLIPLAVGLIILTLILLALFWLLRRRQREDEEGEEEPDRVRIEVPVP